MAVRSLRVDGAVSVGQGSDRTLLNRFYFSILFVTCAKSEKDVRTVSHRNRILVMLDIQCILSSFYTHNQLGSR